MSGRWNVSTMRRMLADEILRIAIMPAIRSVRLNSLEQLEFVDIEHIELIKAQKK